MKVLFIDDDPDSLVIARQRLKKEGYTLIAASDGESGLKKAAEDEPDLILLDVQMPGMSGFEVCEKLKSDQRLMNIPVIFLSAYNDVSEKVRGLDLGAVDYVTKPFDLFELRARVRAALRTKRLQDLLLLYGEVDSLTELYNRRVLMDRLRQEWERARRYSTIMAFIMADIDNFKRVNDTYGHPRGDEVLEKIAAVFRSSVRGVDVVGRYGGEEFAVVMVNANADNAMVAAERYRRSIEELTFAHSTGDFNVTVSFGVADSTNKISVNHLIASADKALYKAKETGRNRICRED